MQIPQISLHLCSGRPLVASPTALDLFLPVVRQGPTPLCVANASAGSSQPRHRRHRFRSSVRLQLAIGSTSCFPPLDTVGARRLGARCVSAVAGLPNTSLNLTRYGRPRLAAPGHRSHCPSAASRVLPTRAG